MCIVCSDGFHGIDLENKNMTHNLIALDIPKSSVSLTQGKI